MDKGHHYQSTITWTGNLGAGTISYKAYDRNHTISMKGKPDILGSSDAAFRGDARRHSPEDSLVAALSACHMLWYLHLCANNNIIVEEYVDNVSGTMIENADGSGQFREVILKPIVAVKESGMIDRALALHHDANKMCFLARSVNFPILHQPEIIVKSL